MASSRVTIYNHWGDLIAELSNVSCVRSWVLDDEGTCTFTLACNDPGFSLANIQFGNLVYIQHVATVNANGSVNGSLPDWWGIIDTPQTWHSAGGGSVDITAYTVEHILKKRPMPYFQPYGNFSDISLQMLHWANFPGGLQIFPGNIGLGNDATYSAGATVNARTIGKQQLRNRKPIAGVNSLFCKTSMYDHMKENVKVWGNDWDVSVQFTSAGHAQLFLNTYDMKGYYALMALDQGFNLEAADPILTVQGNIYNFVNGYNPTNKKSGRLTDSFFVGQRGEIDSASRSDYNLWGENVSLSVAGQDAVDASTKNELNLRSRPVMTFKANALDIAGTYNSLDLGTVWTMTLPNVGFLNGILGSTPTIRVLGMKFDDQKKFCEITSAIYVESAVNA